MQAKTIVGDVMRVASFSLAEVKYTAGDINNVVLEGVSKAQIKIRSKKDNVAGTHHTLYILVAPEHFWKSVSAIFYSRSP